MISRIASFTVAAVLATSALPLAPAAGASATPPWTRPQPSASMDPEKVIAQARSRGHMRVLYALRDGTDLDIRTEEVSGRADAAKYIAQLQRNPQLIAVQIDEKVPVQTASVTDAGPAALSMDPFRQNQWALTQLQAESVWPLGTGSDQTVAVIDTGVLVHQDLAGSFVPGADFVTPGGSGRLTNNTHGTHVAGIIAMTPNNNLGGAGLAPGVSIMPIRMIASENLQSLANLALSVDYAVDAGADVLNMSLAWYPGTNTSVPAAAIQRALDRGVDVVAAAGNEYEKNNPIPFPASYPGVIGVAATTSNNNLSANYSNEGYYVDVAAPGSDILSTTTQGVYAYQDGTSMATPYVAATLALLRSREERVGVRIDEVQLMYDTALELGTPGRDDRYGYGLIQPLRAMQSITAPAPAPPAPAPAPPAPAPPAPAPAPPAPAPPAPAPAPAQPTPKPKSRVTVAIRKDAGKVAFKIRHAGRFRVKLQRKVPGTWVTRATTSRVKGKRWHTFRKKYRGKLRVVVRHSSYRGKSSTVVVF